MAERMQKTKLLVTVALLLGILACQSAPRNLRTETTAPAAPGAADLATVTLASSPALRLVKTAGFDHQRAEHKQLQCQQCHQRDVQVPDDPIPERPYHDACIACHAQERFLSAASTGPFCLNCHQQEVIRSNPEAVQVMSFPEQLRQLGLSRFSHRDHLDAPKMPQATAPSCTSCHTVEERGRSATFPSHSECFGCHVHQAEQQFGSCATCHIETNLALRYLRTSGAATKLYNFRHGTHLRLAKVQNNCVVCHQLVNQPSNVRRSDIFRTNTARGQEHHSACWKCHVDDKEDDCMKCHLDGPPDAGT